MLAGMEKFEVVLKLSWVKTKLELIPDINRVFVIFSEARVME